MIPLILLTGCDFGLSVDHFEKSLVDAVQTASSGIVTIVVSVESDDQDGKVIRTGSGVIIDDNGTIVTTHSVIDGGDSFQVLFQDGCHHDGRIIGSDRETNVALLITDEHAHGCFPIPMGEAGDIELGSIGLVLGNTPISRGISVGWGVMSHSWLGGDDGYCDPLHILQGSSMVTQTGSGVVDVHGNLIGICDNKISGFNGAWAIIPTSTLKRVSRILEKDHSISRGWLGVCINEPYKDQMDNSGGVKISLIVDESPASNIGLKVGEFILTADGEAIKDVNSLRRKITSIQPDKSVKLTIRSSDDARRTVNVPLTKLIDNPQRSCRCRTRSL